MEGRKQRGEDLLEEIVNKGSSLRNQRSFGVVDLLLNFPNNTVPNIRSWDETGTSTMRWTLVSVAGRTRGPPRRLSLFDRAYDEAG